jgi:hypothetical protein
MKLRPRGRGWMEPIKPKVKGRGIDGTAEGPEGEGLE